MSLLSLCKSRNLASTWFARGVPKVENDGRANKALESNGVSVEIGYVNIGQLLANNWIVGIERWVGDFARSSHLGINFWLAARAPHPSTHRADSEHRDGDTKARTNERHRSRLPMVLNRFGALLLCLLTA
jgi:hypothetical protein